MKHIPRTSWCVLDTSGPTDVIRCKHCKHTEPVQFPVDLTAFKVTCDRFLKEHRDCALSLAQLREQADQLDRELRETPPPSKAHDRIRGDLYAVQAIIRRKEPNPNKWPT